MLLYGQIYGGTFMPLFFRLISGANDGGEALLPLLLNPGAFFEEFFMLVMTGNSIFTGNSFDNSDVGFITYALIKSNLWIVISGLVIAGMSLVFMLIAAWKVNPMNSGAGPKPDKKKKEN